MGFIIKDRKKDIIIKKKKNERNWSWSQKWRGKWEIIIKIKFHILFTCPRAGDRHWWVVVEIPWATSLQDLQPKQEGEVRVEGLQALCQYQPRYKVYTGQECGNIPSSTKVVFRLMETGGFLGLGYQLCVDNWYMSPSLFHMLQTWRTNAVGTAQLNRKFIPKDLSVMRKGNVYYCCIKTGLLALM